MSLILDALKRAERERRADGGPSVAEPSLPLPRAPKRRRRWGLVVAVVAAVVVGTAIGWKVVRNKKPRTAAPSIAAKPASPPVIKARPAPPPAQAPAVVPGTEAVASLDDLTEDETPPDETAPAMQPPVPALPPPQPAQPQAESKTAPGAAAEGREPSTTPSPTEPVAIPPALTQPAPLRKFREMPPDYRADFPVLKIEIHVYEKSPAQRFVMVNGRKYREGERMAEGPQLVEIVPEGLVLEYRGERLLYTLGR